MDKKRYYKNQFIILFIDSSDFIRFMADNIFEACTIIKGFVNDKNLSVVTSVIGHAVKRNGKVIIDGRKYSVELIRSGKR